MKAIQIVQETGPQGALQAAELPQPSAGAAGVLIEVHAAGVSFPELLQTQRFLPDQTSAAVRPRQ